MSYAAEELRADIVDLFDDAASLAQYPMDFGALRPVRVPPPSRPRRPPRSRSRGIGRHSLESYKTQVATLLRNHRCVCSRCGARAEIHRCPVRKS